MKLDKYFGYYWSLLDKIIQKNMELLYMKDNLYHVTGTKYEDVPKGGANRDIADQIHNLVEKENEIKLLIGKKDEYRRVYEIKIDKLPNIKCRPVISLYYLDRRPIKEIADILEISISYAKKLKKIGTEDFLKQNKNC